MEGEKEGSGRRGSGREENGREGEGREVTQKRAHIIYAH